MWLVQNIQWNLARYCFAIPLLLLLLLLCTWTTTPEQQQKRTGRETINKNNLSTKLCRCVWFGVENKSYRFFIYHQLRHLRHQIALTEKQIKKAVAAVFVRNLKFLDNSNKMVWFTCECSLQLPTNQKPNIEISEMSLNSTTVFSL